MSNSLKNLSSHYIISKLIEILFIYAWIWPSMRLLMIGRKVANSSIEVIVALTPDLIMTIIFIVTYFYLKKKDLSFQWELIDKLFLFFFFSNVIIGFSLGYDVSIGLQIKAFRLTYWPMLFFLVGKIYHTDKRQFEYLLDKIFRWFILFAIIGFIIHFLFQEFNVKMMALAGYIIPSEYFIQRMGPLVWAPIEFGLLMAMGSVFYVYKIYTNHQKIYFLYLGILWTALLLSVSRGAILSFMIALVYMTIQQKNWKQFLLIVLEMLVIYVVISFLFSIEGKKFIMWILSSTIDTLTIQSGNTRAEQWKVAIQKFIERPYGYGFGKSGFIARWYSNIITVPAVTNITDGWYIKTACETGIYGLLSYLIFSVYLFYQLVQNKTKLVLLFSGAFFLLVNAMNVPSNALDYFPFMSIYWLIMGYSTSQKNDVSS